MRRARQAGTAVILLLLAACGEHGTSPVEPVSPASDPALALAGQSFLRCPTETPISASGTIGILGGTIAAGGHRLTLPPAAVLKPTTFTVTAPASEHVELEVHAAGRDSFRFLVPARITISYERCGDRPVDTEALAVWHIDELTGTLLELMGGSPDAHGRRISFQTGHLSGFIIVN